MVIFGNSNNKVQLLRRSAAWGAACSTPRCLIVCVAVLCVCVVFVVFISVCIDITSVYFAYVAFVQRIPLLVVQSFICCCVVLYIFSLFSCLIYFGCIVLMHGVALFLHSGALCCFVFSNIICIVPT